MTRLDLAQLAQTGAADGDVVTYDDAAGLWVAAAPSGGGGGGGAGQDLRWNLGPGETSVDEFDDGSLDGAWTRVDKSGGTSRATWSEEGDSLGVVNVGTDSSGEVHALVRAVGTSLVAGDGFTTCLRQIGPGNTNYSFSGLILADGTTFTSGSQAMASVYLGTGPSHNLRVETRPHTGYDTSGGGSATSTADVAADQVFLRLVMTAANTWRCDVSPNGHAWITGTTVSLTLTPTHVGFFTSTWGTTTKHATSFEFLRRVSGVS